ncbi:hypothetical protein NDU88_007668 [Pleurodeles waltl]|uniref:Uncharacterized protein n=1 Tax=Pleurodeles waltl TaxID=8319 RepID=A0AAV7NTR1_PLEWA|nr:hypothetical protein NDU88_007668 [Pleurodeles waltl]
MVAMISQGRRRKSGIRSSQTLDLWHSGACEVGRVNDCSDMRPTVSSNFYDIHGIGDWGQRSSRVAVSAQRVVRFIALSEVYVL